MFALLRLPNGFAPNRFALLWLLFFSVLMACTGLDALAAATEEDKGDPSVKDASIERKSPDRGQVSIHYPVLGVPAVDTAIRAFVAETEAGFFKDMDGVAAENDAADAADEAFENWSLTMTYQTQRPSEHIQSIVFSLYIYTGGAHGNAFSVVKNFDRKTGRELDFADLFNNPEKALQLMSDYARKELPALLELGNSPEDRDMMDAGSKPELENFARLLLTPEGLEIYFDPYQVGPWSAGSPVVKMPLSALQAAGPSRAVWQ